MGAKPKQRRRQADHRYAFTRPAPEDDSPAVNAVKAALLDRLEQQLEIAADELRAMGFPEREQAIALRVLETRRFIDIVPTPAGPSITLSAYAREALELIAAYPGRQG